MRVAVVTSRWGSSWDEEHLVTRRLAGALACTAEVDLCVAAGPVARAFQDGAVRVLQFPALPVDDRRTAILRRALLGPGEEDSLSVCSCVGGTARERAIGLPRSVQEEFVRGSGGQSPTLLLHLQDGNYDVVLFVGYRSAATHQGMRVVADGSRVVLWPAASEDPLLHLPIYDEVFARPSVVLACTRTEEALVSRRLTDINPISPSRVSFVLRINPLVLETPPAGFKGDPYLIIARDWAHSQPGEDLRAWAQRLEHDFQDEGLLVRLVGPGSTYTRHIGGIPLSSSRTDVWRWMSRALAVWDPLPHRLLGREVLEAMLCGSPVLVHAHGGATREHAFLGNGGLWFTTYEEAARCVEALLDKSTRDSLSSQASTYADSEYGDSNRYVERLEEAVLA